jgi:hypothetical protein
METAVFNVTATPASIFPLNWLPVPIVADAPTLQKTLPGFPPPVTSTDDPAEVDRVPPIIKTHESQGEPCPARIKIPDNTADIGNL